MKIIEPEVTLLQLTASPLKAIELAGRTCYKSENLITVDSAVEFTKKLKDRGHHAMLEFADATFRIITDRGITHEIVRHRIASFAQESTRYCNYSGEKFGKECSFIEPPNLTKDQELIWRTSCIAAEQYYFRLLKNGCSPQIARSVLPNCLKTEICMKANLREWMHFVKLRESSAAHPQIRPIACAIRETLHEYAPTLFD